MKWLQVTEYYWVRECRRYTVCRSRVFDRDPRGEWCYLAWFRPGSENSAPELLSPQRRFTLESAAKDCMPHIRANVAPSTPASTAAPESLARAA